MLKNIMRASVALAALASPLAAQDAPTRDTVVATVNGTEITLGEVILTTAQLPAQYQGAPAEFLFENVLNQLIQQQLLADTVETSPARVAIALANQERALLAGEAINIFLPESVSEEAIRAAYEENFSAENAATEYSAAHILVATEDEAKAIIERIDAGEAFADLAIELSQDPGSGANGGDLGWFVPEMMVAPFGDTVAGMEDGAVSEPIQTQFGWHVILRNEARKQEAPAFEQVAPELQAQLENDAIEARLEELNAAATIERADVTGFDPAIFGDISLLAN